MSTKQTWSHALGWKILFAAAYLGFAAAVSFNISLLALWGSDSDGLLSGIEVLVTTALAVPVWAVFRLVRPDRWSRRWSVAEFVAVPVVWLILAVALAFWFHHINRQMDSLVIPRRTECLVMSQVWTGEE